MKKVLLSAAALIAAATALPAVAQPYGNAYGHPQNRGYQDNRGWTPIGVRLERLDNRIDRGIERGLLTRREAQALRQQFRQLVQLERYYGRDGGLSYGERADLERRLDILSQRVRWERRDDDRRDRRYDDRYDDRRYDDRRY